jgi:hypothetical protein
LYKQKQQANMSSNLWDNVDELNGNTAAPATSSASSSPADLVVQEYQSNELIQQAVRETEKVS